LIRLVAVVVQSALILATIVPTYTNNLEEYN
jgi:hypothetical protein